MNHSKLQTNRYSQANNLDHIKYRPDIDGLRAIAVLFVMGFHFFPGTIQGGFIGVDIFFVISGFLISGIIFRGLDNQSFSYVEFYKRRIKRIFPALIFILVACLFLGWLVLLAEEYKQLGKHVAAGAGFVSNLALWGESGYFDNAADTKPLLHLWSLGIEEQFYIFWPLLLGFVWKWKHNYLFITVFIAIASFTINIYTVNSDPVASFYSPFSRFWELMLGGLLAYISIHRPQYLTQKTNWQSAMGLLLIVLGMLVISIEKSFPGWRVLLPTVGTFLVISAGPVAWLNRKLLGNYLLVWIGLISYPLYLWHWTLLSFVHIFEEGQTSNEIRIIVILISFILAWLTYKIVEQPVRKSKHPGTLVGFLCGLMVVTGSAGYAAFHFDGFKFRSAVTAFMHKAENLVYLNHWSEWELCKNEGKSNYCRVLIPSEPIDIAVIGDSHAGHFASGLPVLFHEQNKNIIVRLAAGCMPFYSTTINGKAVFECENNVINKALDQAIASTSIKTIILAGFGNLVLHGRNYSVNQEYFKTGYTIGFSGLDVEENIKAFRKALHITLKKLTGSGKYIVFMVDVPELYFNPRECISLRRFTLPFHKLRQPCSIERRLFEERTSDYHQLIAEAENLFPTVKFIHTYEYLCDDISCEVLVDGHLLFSSRDHLSIDGSVYLVNKIKDQLN